LLEYKEVTMSKEFVPYELSLELKQLGFDEECLADYFVFGDGILRDGRYGQTKPKLFMRSEDVSEECEELSMFAYHDVYVPLYQQAFRWFREKYQLHSTITSISQESWQWHITKPGESLGKLYDEDFYTYEQAELACLQKLIEIVKTK
jgi:hypothetical protein